VSARIWQQSSGIGVRLVPAASADRAVVFGRDAIPAGRYLVELYCPGIGIVDAGAHDIGGAHRLELRNVTLPPTARVTFVLPPDREVSTYNEFELVRRGRAVDHRIPTVPFLVGPHVLGPGRYTVFWRERGALREHTFDVDGRRQSFDARLP
jgi:hypothetical protein